LPFTPTVRGWVVAPRVRQRVSSWIPLSDSAAKNAEVPIDGIVNLSEVAADLADENELKQVSWLSVST
jgi:hypothetical protein